MLKTLSKNFSLIATIAVIIIASVGGYYVLTLKQGKYKASSFDYIIYKWGVGDSLPNSYSSKTGKYQYLDNRDQLIKKNLILHTNEVIYLNSKFNDIDFWTLPDVIANKSANLKDPNVLRYEITLSYDGVVKKVTYLKNYEEDRAIASRADALQQVITQTINESEDRYTN